MKSDELIDVQLKDTKGNHVNIKILAKDIKYIDIKDMFEALVKQHDL